MQTILRRHDVEKVTGLARSTIYAKIAEGEFPKPVKITGRSVGWLETEIEKWHKSCIDSRDGEAA